jgi:ferredoxin-nitrite reductase
LADFLPREDVVAAAEALVEVFVAHGDPDHPKRGRMKFVVAAMGADAFAGAFHTAFGAARRRRPSPAVPPAELLDGDAVAAVLSVAPENGWGHGVRPQRTPGRAMVTVNVPLGDLDSADMRLLAGLARTGDGCLHLTRNQNVQFRDVPVDEVAPLRRHLAMRRLGPAGADGAGDVRACTGSAVCSLAITAAPRAGARLLDSAALARNSSLRVHVSGCPNSCAQHQAADIGLSGAKVRINGRTRLGYHVWLGADLEHAQLGQIAGRVAEEDVEDVVERLVGVYEALRWPGESMAATVRRIGLDAFAAHVSAVADRFEPGPDELDLVA